jgi:predicted nucleic acid-binding Zn ribbon protein
MSHRDAPESLAGLVPKVLEEVGLSEASLGMRLLRVWDEALGPELAPHCRPEGIRRGVIQARVADSAWMQRLQMEKPGILRGLRKALEEEEIDLRLRIGTLEERPGGA